MLSDPKPKDDRPFTVGYREFPMTGCPPATACRMATSGAARGPQLLVLHQLDQRSTIASPGTSRSPRPRRYEAVVYYTCAKADVGLEDRAELQGEHRVEGA